MISFARLTPEDAPRVDHLTLGPGQERFTAHPATRLGRLREGEEAWAILWAGDVVGFLIVDLGYPAQYSFATGGEAGLRAVLIDAGRQGQGLGSAAMAALPGLMAADYPRLGGLVLTVNQANPGAKAVYLKAGFVDTGVIYEGGRSGPQNVLRLRLG